MDDERLHLFLRLAVVRLVGLLVLAGCGQAAAVEVRLRTKTACPAGVVRLQDLAELQGDPQATAALGQTELLPAPLAGQERRLTARELCDLLELRGVDTSALHMTGASQVAIVCGEADERLRGKTRKPGALPRRHLESIVASAVKKHLEQVADPESFGEISPQLSEAALQQLSAVAGPLAASGGQAPWTGTQQFTISTAGGEIQATVVVDVCPAPRVLVLRRPLNRGAVLGPADVELAPQHASARLDDAFENLDDVLGKELLQGGVAGQVLRRTVLRAPLLVKQGQPVTVYSRAGGIQIRTVGVAKEDGSLGELVAIESPESKQRYFARVAALQEVEVWATSAAANSSASTAAASHDRQGAAR